MYETLSTYVTSFHLVTFTGDIKDIIFVYVQKAAALNAHLVAYRAEKCYTRAEKIERVVRVISSFEPANALSSASN